jgi:putative addiction module component (TIGR02574 family)
MTALAESITALPPEEQLQLVWDIWDHLASDESKIPLSEKVKRELDKTLAEYRRTGNKGDTWDVVKARILGSR